MARTIICDSKISILFFSTSYTTETAFFPTSYPITENEFGHTDVNRPFIAFQELPPSISSCGKERILKLTNDRLRRPTDSFPRLTYDLLRVIQATVPGRRRRRPTAFATATATATTAPMLDFLAERGPT